MSRFRVPQTLYHTPTKKTSTRHASTTSFSQDNKGSKKQRVVILGSGWAGYAFARTLSPSKYTRILLSPRSHFVFTPLLASTSVGTLEFRAAVEPLRRLGLDEVHHAWASDIDFANKVVRAEANPRADFGARTQHDQRGLTTEGEGGGSATARRGPEFEVAYDKLVVAVGCYSQTFGVEGVKEHACFLRDVGDARAIRLRILAAFDKASLPTTTDRERARLLHFVVVGGGPTGVEFAAELHDLITDDLSKLYPDLVPHVAITIYDVAPKVLPMFDAGLAAYAADLFHRRGIRIKTEHHLERIRRDGDVLMLRVREEPDEVGAGLVIWSTGLMQNPLVGSLTSKETKGVGRIASDAKTGGIITDAHMRVQLEAEPSQGQNDTTRILPDVYAIGDCSVVQGERFPATAQVASQQAVYLAKHLNKHPSPPSSLLSPLISSSPSSSSSSSSSSSQTSSSLPEAFKFRNWGALAYLGNGRAIHQSSADELRGWPAWVLWRAAYLTRSMSLRNKIMIPVHWLITWVCGRDVSRF